MVSAKNRVFDILYSQIMTFKLEPNEQLSEKVLSETLGTSRTPVREALAKLAAIGLVDIYAQRGTLVAPLREADLIKSQFVREALEVALVARAVTSPNREYLVRKLRDEIEVQKTMASINDNVRFIRSDEIFHKEIANHVDLSGIWADISAAKLHMDRFRFLTFPRVDNMITVIDQHGQIVDEIERSDTIRAEQAMRQHLRRIFTGVDAVKERYPHYLNDSWSRQETSDALDTVGVSGFVTIK